ncbi:MAG: chain length determinant protein tyrosine kinase EpsG [Caulobacteraceae bacterium]|jgi:protein-tyrosine kinase|nr:chain length determinant protein tyrosine kinase EpsG [Caulobacteraceae bacterium]
MSETLTLQSGRPAAAGAQERSDGAAYGFAPDMVTVLSPIGPRADAIRALRTHVMAQHINLGRRALAICAPSANVGCSFVAANLAVSLSQIGVKTLLIDGDLRRPALDLLIRPPQPSPGLAQCLQSPDEPFGANIDTAVLPQLSVMYAGHAAANPQELLAGDRFRSLMKFCLREFDATIVDTPPANTSTDARRISGVAGYSLIVTQQNKTFVRDVMTLAGQLKADRAVVIGTVMNQA